MTRLSFITANRAGKVRETKLNGRSYVVAPVVMIKQGVLPGSNGKILYTNAAVNRRIERWNGMPLTLGHPEDDKGGKVSARSPDVADKFQIGAVYNTAFAGEKLKAEAWFDVEATNATSPGLIAKVKKGDKVELSTGLFTNVAAKAGKDSSGKDYTHELRGYEPDHLAVLLDEKGACSLTDGCGVNTNSSSETETLEDSTPLLLALNSLSHGDINRALQRLLIDKLADVPEARVYVRDSDYEAGPTQTGRVRVSVEDVFPDYVIFETGPYSTSKTYRHNYSIKDSTITLTGDKIEVVSSRVHKPVKVAGKSMTFASNAKKKASGGNNCGIGSGGFAPGNTCAKGSGRAGFGKAATATPAQKKTAKKRAESGGTKKPSKKPLELAEALKLATGGSGYPTVLKKLRDPEKAAVLRDTLESDLALYTKANWKGMVHLRTKQLEALKKSPALKTAAKKTSPKKSAPKKKAPAKKKASKKISIDQVGPTGNSFQLTANCGDTPCGPCAAKKKAAKKKRTVNDLFTANV